MYLSKSFTFSPMTFKKIPLHEYELCQRLLQRFFNIFSRLSSLCFLIKNNSLKKKQKNPDVPGLSDTSGLTCCDKTTYQIGDNLNYNSQTNANFSAIYPRCLIPSNSKIVAAIAALSDSARPAIGMMILLSTSRAVSGEMPLPSLPISNHWLP